MVVFGRSKSLASKVTGDGVTGNVATPGPVHTQRVDGLSVDPPKRICTGVREVACKFAAANPAGRYGRSKEFIGVVVILASVRGSYATGSRGRADGGGSRSIQAQVEKIVALPACVRAKRLHAVVCWRKV